MLEGTLLPVLEQTLKVGIEVPPELTAWSEGVVSAALGFSGSEATFKPLFCKNSNCSLLKSSPEQLSETAWTEGVHTVPCSSVQGEGDRVEVPVHADEGG